MRIAFIDSPKLNVPITGIFAKLYDGVEDLYYYLSRLNLKRKLNDVDLVIAVDSQSEQTLEMKGMKFSKINEFISAKDYKIYEKEAMKYKRDLPLNNKSLAIKYKDQLLWHTEELDIFYSFLKPQIYKIESLHKILKEKACDKIIIFDRSTEFGKLLNNFDDPRVTDRSGILSKSKAFVFRILVPFILKRLGKRFVNSLKPVESVITKKDIVFFGKERGFKYSIGFLDKFKDRLKILKINDFEMDYSFDSTSVKELLDKEMVQDIRTFSEKIKHIKLGKGTEYKNVNIGESLIDLFDYLKYYAYLKSAFYIEVLDKYFSDYKPKLMIIMAEAKRNFKVALMYAKKYNVKTLFVMHGTFGENMLYWKPQSDRFAMFGEFYKQIFLNLGADEKRIYVTGNPAWDDLAVANNLKSELLDKYNLRGKKIITYATIHYPHDIRDRVAYAVIESMKKYPDYKLVIKLHPEEKPDLYKKLLKRLNYDAIIIDDLNMLHPLISISECVIVCGSTVGLEALLLNKPVIDVNMTSLPYYQNYVNDGVALGAKSKDELVFALNKILTDDAFRKKLTEKREEYIFNHAYKQDGKASERVAKIINEMIK